MKLKKILNAWYLYLREHSPPVALSHFVFRYLLKKRRELEKMKKQFNEKEIFSSWRNCVQSGLRSDLNCPVCPLTSLQLDKLLRDCRLIAAALESGVARIENMLTARSAFFLTDMRGILIKKIPERSCLAEFKEGISLAECYSGTNAIALEIEQQKPVQSLPEHHYCEFLRDKHCYATPLRVGKQLACLAVIAKGEPIHGGLMACVHLLARNMELNYILRSIEQQDSASGPLPVAITKKQRLILLCLAKGMSDKEAAAHLHICFDTVRFHKRNLYRKLEVDCGVSAVVKALRSEIISLEELELPLEIAVNRCLFE